MFKLLIKHVSNCVKYLIPVLLVVHVLYLIVDIYVFPNLLVTHERSLLSSKAISTINELELERFCYNYCVEIPC